MSKTQWYYNSQVYIYIYNLSFLKSHSKKQFAEHTYKYFDNYTEIDCLSTS